MEKDELVNSPITPPLPPKAAIFDFNDPAYLFGYALAVQHLENSPLYAGEYLSTVVNKRLTK